LTVRRRGVLVVLLIAYGVAGGGLGLWAAQGALTFPRPTGYVNDVAHLLAPPSRASLEQRLAQYDKTTGNQIAIAIFPDLGGVPINDFSVGLEEAWKVGRRGKDNGLLLLVAVAERQVRIEVGYGLEGKVTDADAGTIIRDVIAPAFRAGRYGDGLSSAVDEIIRLIGSGPLSPAATPPSGRTQWISGQASGWLGFFILVMAFIGLALIFSWAQARRCPRCGARLELGPQRSGPLEVSATGQGAAFVEAWVCPKCGYREKAVRRQSMGLPGPIWLGGGAGGWGSGGFSGGGFGGFGGGFSGGGGASGSW
jgi:uncharacterized protein